MFLVNDGSQHRSFTHIDDATTAFQVLLDHGDAHNEVFNVGNPKNDTTIRGLALLMQRLYEEQTGQTPGCELVSTDGVTFYGEGYEDVSRPTPNISKLQSLGWEPEHDLVTTFADAMASYLPSSPEGC